MSFRTWLVAFAASIAAAALAVRPADAVAAERCCFLVEANVSGWMTQIAGRDLEEPGATTYRASWRWTVRHVARYVEHGRIFNALTAPRARVLTRSALSVRIAESRAELREPTCRRQLARRLDVARDRAYVSLEDTFGGTMALVVRVRSPLLRGRCHPDLRIPPAHVTSAPAGMTLRGARHISLAWREEIRGVEVPGFRGFVFVHVRMHVMPGLELARARRLLACKC